MTLRPLKTWYDKMLPRERFMLIAFVWVMVLIWLGAFMNQVKAMKATIADTQSKLEEQKTWLDQKDIINSKLEDLTVKFEHSYNANELYDTVNQLLKDDKDLPAAAFTVTQEATRKQKIFNVNTVTVRLKSVPWRNLIEFTQKIRLKQPYFTFERFHVVAEPLNPTIYTADMRINSLELITDAATGAGAATSTAKK
jgi:type II secretory pathway component PulM